MGSVSLDNLEPGMVLAEDASSGNNVLLGKGQVLTEKHIQTFRQWGLIDAEIEGTSDQDISRKEETKIDPALMDAAKKKVVPYFKHTNLKFQPIVELCRICIQRKVAELAMTSNRKGTDEA